MHRDAVLAALYQVGRIACDGPRGGPGLVSVSSGSKAVGQEWPLQARPKGKQCFKRDEDSPPSEAQPEHPAGQGAKPGLIQTRSALTRIASGSTPWPPHAESCQNLG